MNGSEDITQLLVNASEGDSGALDSLLPLVYDELRSLAKGMMQKERTDHTLQATALVHEAYLKLVDQTRVEWQGRSHFFAVAARAIRRILVDYARGYDRMKRGGGRVKLSLEESLIPAQVKMGDLIELDESLVELAESNPEQARIVEMSFFAGLTFDEIAEVLGISKRSVERKWRFARALLFQIHTAKDREGPRG